MCWAQSLNLPCNGHCCLAVTFFAAALCMPRSWANLTSFNSRAPTAYFALRSLSQRHQTRCAEDRLSLPTCLSQSRPLPHSLATGGCYQDEEWVAAVVTTPATGCHNVV